MKPTSYIYPAKLIKVTDGDTILCRVNLKKTIDYGFYFEEESTDKFMTLKFRLMGIDCPEKYKDREGWQAAKEHITILLGDGELLLETFKDGAFGRWICIVWKDGVNINQRMIEDGFAKEYKR